MSKKIEGLNAFWYAVLSCDAIEAINIDYPGTPIQAQAAARDSVLQKLQKVLKEIMFS